MDHYLYSSETLTELLQRRQKVRVLESKMAEFCLSQRRGEGFRERQLRTEPQNQPNDTTAKVDRRTERREVEKDDAHFLFEPDLAFMVNNSSSSIEELLRSTDRHKWIDAINN